MLKLYVDSSVMIKRYVSEAGTELVDEIFDRAEESKLNLSHPHGTSGKPWVC